MPADTMVFRDRSDLRRTEVSGLRQPFVSPERRDSPIEA
jgi:hypothetical protein